jgi:hypothetical protein
MDEGTEDEKKYANELFQNKFLPGPENCICGSINFAIYTKIYYIKLHLVVLDV